MPLPKDYDPKSAEKKWQEFWSREGIFRFNPASGRPVYSIDTPPPTVSGKLHIGHVYSYTQTEIIARYFRLRGFEVYYPFGFDNNGLPTEILAEREHNIRASSLPRKEFSRLCLETSRKYTEQFRELWQSIGFSCDWDEVYYTIDERSQRISQRSFLDLHRKGFIYKREAPTLWCTRCQTAFAQAEIDDKPQGAVFHYFHFGDAESGEKIPVATTRPELLCACVAVFIHPQNTKFSHLIGRQARVPLFCHTVPILADEKADPEKGTGVVMCCTFGDTQDIDWWRKYRLPLRLTFSDEGRMNELAGEFQGLSIRDARTAVAKKLHESGIAFRQVDIPAAERMVNTHERCGTEVEYLVKRQWFVNIMDHKQKIIEAGSRVRWFPEYMKTRFVNWVSSLAWDWCISRQRYFGVPIPAWTCRSCNGTILADESQLPVNPISDPPAAGKCPACGKADLLPESDVFDTWATSSVTPQINCKWGESDDRSKLMFPMSMRPQAHDIIRTWAFYTIVKSLYHHGSIPWRDAVISGHILKKETQAKSEAVIRGKSYTRKSKISKSKDGDAFSPQRILAAHSVDCLRFWTCGATLGADTYFDDDEVDDNRRLLIKLWNAGRFVIENLERQDFQPSNTQPLKPRAVDLWILGRLRQSLTEYHDHFEAYDFHAARNTVYLFFWHDFCDNYLEFVKGRLAAGSTGNPETRAACQTLYDVFFIILQLFAPFIPHITEELYQAYYRQLMPLVSLQQSVIPTAADLRIPAEAEETSRSMSAGEILVETATLIRAYKTGKAYSLRLPLQALLFFAGPEEHDLVRLVEKEICDYGAIPGIDYRSIDAADTLPDAYELQEAAKLKLALAPDQENLFLLSLVQAVKSAVAAKKKECGLAAKAEIAKLTIAAADPGLRKKLQAGEEKLKYATSAAGVEWGETGSMTEVPGYPGLKVAID